MALDISQIDFRAIFWYFYSFQLYLRTFGPVSPGCHFIFAHNSLPDLGGDNFTVIFLINVIRIVWQLWMVLGTGWQVCSLFSRFVRFHTCICSIVLQWHFLNANIHCHVFLFLSQLYPLMKLLFGKITVSPNLYILCSQSPAEHGRNMGKSHALVN